MYFRNAFASSSVLCFVALSVSASSPSFAAEADPKGACLAAADTGQSLRDDGQYAIAREQFLACARDVCPKLVHDQCTEWLRHLDEATPTVVFGAKDDQGHDVSEARVLLDGKLLMTTLDGKPTPLDPGPHDIRFEREPNGAVTMHVVLRTGEKNREVSATFPAVEGQRATPPEGAESPPAASPGEEQKASRPFWNGRTVTSASLLAGGVLAVGFGVFFGLQSQSENNQAATLRGQALNDRQTSGGAGAACPSPSFSPACQQLSDTVDAQNRDAVLNEVLYITGGVLAVGAVASWFLWPKRQEEQASTTWVVPMVGPAHAGIGLGGAF